MTINFPTEILPGKLEQRVGRLAEKFNLERHHSLVAYKLHSCLFYLNFDDFINLIQEPFGEMYIFCDEHSMGFIYVLKSSLFLI